MAWAVTMCLFWAAVLSISLPRMLQVLGAIGVVRFIFILSSESRHQLTLSFCSPSQKFCFYAGLNMVAFVLLILFLPETKQRTLEELDQVGLNLLFELLALTNHGCGSLGVLYPHSGIYTLQPYQRGPVLFQALLLV